MLEYTGFAQVYDTFMDNVPYSEWGDYIHDLLKEYNIEDGIVLELGCGTGKMTSILSDLGYDMIGIDNSSEMLYIAVDNKENRDILYLLQDMRQFELYGTVRAIIIVCDSINYITDKEDLLKVFKLVNNYLDPNGIFIFDVNTYYKYQNILADNTIAENREECSFIWENFFDESDCINEYDLTLFIKEGGLYRKFEETHFQRAYKLEELKEIIEQSGLEYVIDYDAYTKNKINKESERICIVCREKGKAI